MVEGSPTVDSVDGAGGGWVSEMEVVGGFMSGREVLDGDFALTFYVKGMLMQNGEIL